MAQLAAAYQDPSNPVTEEEARALVAYLQSLEPDPDAPVATATPLPTPTATAPDGTPTATPITPTGGSELQIESVENQNLFDKDSLVIKEGSQVTVSFANKANIAAIQHNWVLVRAGTEDSVATAGLAAGPGSDWIPKDDPNVIDYVRLLDGGDSDKVTFDAPPPRDLCLHLHLPGAQYHPCMASLRYQNDGASRY